MTELNLFSAVLIGLLGSTHCLGMCGGMAAATGHGSAGLARLLSYNGGRLLSYGLIGALAGLTGQTLLAVAPQLTVVLRTLAGILLVAMGLYVSQWWMGLTRLEQVGARLWRYIQPATRQLLPVRHHRQAVALGLLWGLLPCGLVYSALSWALAAANWRQSGLLMLAFGVGTLPAMLGVGLLNDTLLGKLRQKNCRRVAGLLIIAMGIWTMMAPLSHMQHTGSDHHQDAVPAAENVDRSHIH